MGYGTQTLTWDTARFYTILCEHELKGKTHFT